MKQVGFCWAGSPTHTNDRHRSARAEDFAPLLECPDIAFFSLQKGPQAEQLAQLMDRDRKIGEAVVPATSEVDDFAHTAALIDEMDLVITVDTSVAHFAGALGKECWVLLSTFCDWRWMIDRDDSPWYPSLRIFRQAEPGDWHELMQRVARELIAFCREG